ncbi:hypothetical protein [Streptomyces sp. NPDC002545]
MAAAAVAAASVAAASVAAASVAAAAVAAASVAAATVTAAVAAAVAAAMAATVTASVTASVAAASVVTVGTHRGLRRVSRSGGSCGPRRADRCTTGHEHACCGNRKEVLQTLCLHDLYLLCFIDLRVVGHANVGRSHSRCAA